MRSAISPGDRILGTLLNFKILSVVLSHSKVRDSRVTFPLTATFNAH